MPEATGALLAGSSVRFGLTFGLVYREPDEAGDVEVLPGNYMAFFEPGDDGAYDT